jgi:DNA-binding MarR family transcriptional regulator
MGVKGVGQGTILHPREGDASWVNPTAPPTPRSELVRDLAVHALATLRGVQHIAQRAFEPLGLSIMQAVALEMIARGIDHPKALAEGLETVQSAVSARLAELETRGLIARHPDPDDRRVARLTLTERGQRTLAEIAQAWITTTEARLADVATDDLHAVARVMRHLTHVEGA